jgi:hypothetical protein
MIQAKDLVFEYIRRDEEGNVESITRAIDEVDIKIKNIINGEKTNDDIETK